MSTYFFKFSQLPGDLINFLPGIKHVCERDNRKAIIVLGLDINWQTPYSATRESASTLTQKTFDSIKPLLLSQSYIADVVSWQEFSPRTYELWCDFFKILRTPAEMIEFHNTHFNWIIDLDKIYLTPTNIPFGNIHRWPWYCYPDMACDLSVPWLEVEPDDSMQDMIVVNRTLRARNEGINYRFLSDHKVLFVGHSDEYEDFMRDNELHDLRYCITGNIMELAIAIRSCKFFIGNQSLCFALAEAMKVPRILETCRELPNVIPSGQKAYDFYFQSTLEYYFNELNR